MGCGKTVCAPCLEQKTNPRHMFLLSLFPCLHMLERCSVLALSIWYKQSMLGRQRRWQQTVCLGVTKISRALVNQAPFPDFQTLILGGQSDWRNPGQFVDSSRSKQGFSETCLANVWDLKLCWRLLPILGTSASTQALLGTWLQRSGLLLGRWQGRQGHGFANFLAHLSSRQC